MNDEMKSWWRASGIRALKTAAQSAIAAIGATATMGAVDWVTVGSTCALAAILSLLTSVAGIPEVGGGASVGELSRGITIEDGR